jgi:hypothetical protein
MRIKGEFGKLTRRYQKDTSLMMQRIMTGMPAFEQAKSKAS